MTAAARIDTPAQPLSLDELETSIQSAKKAAIGLVEGGICNAENVHVLREFRRNCKILVAMGGNAIKPGDFEIVNFPGINVFLHLRHFASTRVAKGWSMAAMADQHRAGDCVDAAVLLEEDAWSRSRGGSFWGLVLTYLYFQIPLMILIMAPAIDGLTAVARLRGTAVKLAAAARSGGVTTAIT